MVYIGANALSGSGRRRPPARAAGDPLCAASAQRSAARHVRNSTLSQRGADVDSAALFWCIIQVQKAVPKRRARGKGKIIAMIDTAQLHSGAQLSGGLEIGKSGGQRLGMARTGNTQGTHRSPA